MNRKSSRPPAVAGMFYPSDPRQLSKEVSACLTDGRTGSGRNPKALIAPHAGYPYSGPIAGSAFSSWQGAASVERMILVGPCHRLAFTGLALSSAEVFETPLGKIRLEALSGETWQGLKGVQVLDEAHAEEHSLEVMLPFLQTIFKDFALVPILVGVATGGEVAEVLDRLWGGAETRIVISSDLSHYLPYEAAQRLDQRTAQAIEELRPEAIEEDQACGRIAIQGLLEMARRKHLRSETIDLRNSGDTAGSRARVVGYGAFSFREAD